MTTAHIHRPSSRGLQAALTAIAACIVAAGASAASAASAATPPSDAPSVVVRYADLDITTRQGASALYRRIAAAAQRVCPDADIRDLDFSSQIRACQQQAIARAVQAISSPLLAALYEENAKHG
jgi:UrcA family protein